MLIMVGARWSEPSSNRTIEEYCIGNIERETFLTERKSLEELRFVTRKEVLLQGFTLHSMYLKDYEDVELLITVKKNSKTFNSDSKVLLKEVRFVWPLNEEYPPSFKPNIDLMDNIILESDSIYSLEISCEKDYFRLTSSTEASEHPIFSILPQSNSKMIALLRYSTL